MTNYEARQVTGKLKIGDALDSTEKLDALMTAMNALKKQIPMKPHKSRSEYYCPMCAERDHKTCVGKIHYGGSKSLSSYCFNCGQAIDWTEVDA